MPAAATALREPPPSIEISSAEPVENPPARFLERVLEEPSYGWRKDGKFYKPTTPEITAAFRSRLNPFVRKNWLSVTGAITTFGLMPFGFVFLFKYLSFSLVSFALFALGFVYSMFWLGTHGTIWFHRYATHRAYTFTNSFYRFVCRNLTIKIVPDETYVISHHVHHAFSEEAGDPYNVHGGFLYVFLAAETHQPIAKNLSREDYAKLTRLLNHTGVHLNSYEQYQYWGSLCHPFYTWMHYVLNWSFWYAVFYAIGGHPLACVLFGWSSVWAIGVRTFNWDGHGGGKDKRRVGIDFNDKDFSINQSWPGYIAGEWHNNHHLYPNGVRAGFLPYQLDSAWAFIRFYKLIGGISSWRDYTERFYAQYYNPYLESLRAGRVVAPPQRITPDTSAAPEPRQATD